MRILNITQFFKELQQISSHGSIDCGLKSIEIISERKLGLLSNLKLKCKMCNETFVICCNNPETDININTVAGAIAIGCGHSQLNELLAAMDLPQISYTIFNKRLETINKVWEKETTQSMNEAAKEERRLAFDDDKVTDNGIPFIDVIADGCWGKRSYRKNYSALSGAAAIIGKRTGKILFMAVKNKYCCKCAQASKKYVTPKEHDCYKNYSGDDEVIRCRMIRGKNRTTMGTVDSGNETLFSDDSSVDMVASPDPFPIRRAVHARVTESPASCRDFGKDNENELRSLPPKIQPYSGVLGNGKVVIRPIAFKPMGAPTGGRLSNIGERYGSTPVLNSRPGSHMTLYGSSSDLRPSHHYHYGVSNHSLDRKLQLASSASPQVTSLSSLPASINVQSRKMAYDSLESIRKSPAISTHGHNGKLSMLSYTTTSNGSASMQQGNGSLLDLAPSPSDSGVSELEAAMRDRDTDLHRRHNGDHSDMAPFGETSRLYREKERMWERELHRMKAVHESRLRAGAQKALKLEQMLMMQTYQLQQDKKRLSVETEKTNREVTELKQEADHLRSRLEDTEWNLCQKTGEIALLKTQLKDAQNDQTTKGHELLQVKGEFRQTRDRLEAKEKDFTKLRLENEEKGKSISQLQAEINRLNNRLKDSDKEILKIKDKNQCEVERLKSELKELREELSDVSLSGYDGIESGRSLRGGSFEICKNAEYHWNSNDSSLEDAEVQRLNGELPDLPECRASAEIARLKLEMNAKDNEFQKERRKWSEEKEKVLRYQKQLQLNYVQMFRRSRALESEVENLTLELQLNNKNTKNVNGLSKTIEL